MTELQLIVPFGTLLAFWQRTDGHNMLNQRNVQF
jgi:hypothetical protein